MSAAIIIMVVACKKKEITTNINYPAAYIVNGEDASISVINLSKNEVTETIELMGTGSDMIMWPHHIYNHENHLAIGVPGMDLSAGHSGGMAGMECLPAGSGRVWHRHPESSGNPGLRAAHTHCQCA